MWSLATADGRRAWAFVVIVLGCVVFTCFAAVGVWLVSKNAYYTLLLALAAHGQLFIGMGAFSFVLGRRMRVKGGKEGFDYEDTGSDKDPETPAEGAAAATKAATEAGNEITQTLKDNE